MVYIVCVHLCAQEEATLYRISLRLDFSLNLGLMFFATVLTASKLSPIFAAYQCWHYRRARPYPAYLLGAGVQTKVLTIVQQATLTTEPSLQIHASSLVLCFSNLLLTSFTF